MPLGAKVIAEMVVKAAKKNAKMEIKAALLATLSSKARRICGMYFRQSNDVKKEIQDFLTKIG